jgi:16S rRNA (uracil1498-N3)-methyltransferase
LIPEIAIPVAFAELLNAPAANDRVLFSERDGEPFESMAHKDGPITALVGSEGGWTKDELDKAKAAGWKLMTLGGRTLRAETAAIVAATLLQHRFGDLK